MKDCFSKSIDSLLLDDSVEVEKCKAIERNIDILSRFFTIFSLVNIWPNSM